MKANLLLIALKVKNTKHFGAKLLNTLGVLALVLFSTTTYAQPLSATDMVIVGSQNTPNNWGRGFDFIPNVDLYVTDIGKRVPADNGTYVWKIWETNTQTLVFEQTSSGTTPGTYTYEPVNGGPITLTAGQPYTLTLYTDTGDYYFGVSNQINSNLTYVTMRYCNNCWPAAPFPTTLLNNYHYGTPDFLFELAPPPGGGGGSSAHCEPSDCLLVGCPADVTVACIEDYVADAANATAVFNCTGSGGNDIVETFNYTGGVQTFTVPAGVNVVTINAFGAQGGANAVGLAGASGGDASGNLIVSPGDVLEVYVGGMGSLSGGFNGGGNGGAIGCANSQGGGGGGASDVRIGGSTLANRIIVAAGGGGAGGQRNVGCGPGSGGGAGGGYYGGGGGGGYQGGPGLGGSQTAGGAGGIGNFGGGPGGVGTLGMGGNGGSAPANNQGGTAAGPPGGDGGGLNGENGGTGNPNWRGGGGGGGSSYVDGVLNGETNAGTNNGDGRIEISYDDGSGGGGVGTEAFRYVDPPHATGAANCPGTTYEITYHVGDNLGNVGCCVQLVTIENDPPVVTVPPGETVTCYEDIPISSGFEASDGTGTGDAEVSTTCNGPFDLKILPPVVEGVHQCPGTTYTYAYRVRDNCGREVVANRVYTIGSNAAPTIIAPPDMTISCAWNAEINPDYATVTTGCTLGYTTTVTGPTTTGSDNCPGATYTYTYTVTDDCGRTASDTRKFTVANTAPVFLNCPSVPLQLNCEDEGWQQVIQAWLASVQAESSCSSVINVTNNYNPNSQGLCINNGTKIVRFFATDACGRTTTCEGMVIVADTEPPLFVEAPQDELVVCNYITQDKLDAWVDAHGYAEVEDCWANVNWSTFPNNPTINCGGNPGPTSITVTFVATDGCGNKASMDATFTALPAMGGIGGSTEDIAEESMQLFQNQPNPFSDETSISFYLPQGGKATLSIYDVSGKLLKEINGEYSEGMNVEAINRSDLQGAGMLYYKLSTATETATQRMILLD